jgi:hypothetical protein
MLQRLVFLTAWLFMFGAVINPGEAQKSDELTRLFDAYNAAAKAGHLDKMLSLCTAERQKEIRAQTKKKEERDSFLLMARAQVPESYQVQHVASKKNGQAAKLFLLGQFPAMPEAKREHMRMEEAISFKREKGVWKISSALPLGDPDTVKRPKDLTCDSEEANPDLTSEIEGRIVKTDFNADYTLVLLRVKDDEYAVFLPDKEVLQKAGMQLDELDPWRMIEFTGHPHKSDKLKFFAAGRRLIED